VNDDAVLLQTHLLIDIDKALQTGFLLEDLRYKRKTEKVL
jgi:hypothetical protein